MYQKNTPLECAELLGTNENSKKILDNFKILNILEIK